MLLFVSMGLYGTGELHKVAGTENPKSTGGLRRSVSGCWYGKFYNKTDKTLQLHDMMQP
jgi:hypothetical protein